jgi:hypothetical protein
MMILMIFREPLFLMFQIRFTFLNAIKSRKEMVIIDNGKSIKSEQEDRKRKLLLSYTEGGKNRRIMENFFS